MARLADDILVGERPQPAAVVPAAAPARRAFLHHVNLMRGLAILSVVGAHCAPCFDWGPREQAAVTVALDNVTILFMFIAGLLFQHLSDTFEYRTYLKRRFSQVVLPYVIISIPAILMVIFVQHRDDVWPWVYEMPKWKQALFFLYTGKQLAPLWFIPMMALYILASPLLVWIDRQDLYKWLLPPLIVAGTFLGRDWVPGLANVFGKAFYMLPVYLAGMGYSRHRVAVEAWGSRHWRWLAAGLVLSSAGLAVHAWGLDFTMPQRLLESLVMLQITLRMPQQGWVSDRLKQLADVSFGIYFVHGYVITSARIVISRFEKPYIHQGAILPATFLGLIASIALVATVATLIVLAVRKVFGRRSRMIVGA